MNRHLNFTRSLLLCTCLATAAHADWPQFLGPQRNGIQPAKDKLMDKFPDAGLPVVWKFSCGDGFAGPVVQDGKVYLFHRQGTKACLDCLKAATGEKIWQFSYQTTYRDAFGFDPGPRSSPTLTTDAAVLYGADGMLCVVELKNGSLRWKRDLATDLQSPPGFFGRCGAPLVVGEKIMLGVGGTHENKPAAAAAFSLKDGKLLWQAGDQEAGYASPLLLSDKAHVLFFLRDGLMVSALEDGKVSFTEHYRAEMEASVNASTPVLLSDGKFFASACYGVGAGVWQPAEGKWKRAWQKQEVLDCHYGTPVFYKGHLYGIHGRQEEGTQLRCVDPVTAEVKWSSQTMPAAELLVSDEKLLCLTDKGELLSIAADPASYKELDRAQILKAGHRSPPALSGGILYARDRATLQALRLAAE